MRFFAFALLVTLLISTPASAWHDVGHRATASIAFAAMSTQQQQKVIDTLKEHPRFAEDFTALMPIEVANASASEQGVWLLKQAAIWPDLVETLQDDVRTEYNRSRWHYINLVIYLSQDDEATLSGNLEHNMSTLFEPPLRQNLNIVQALRGNLQIWRAADASDAERAVALCWILHLTGDMHQPLHNVALFSRAYFPGGDRGGNSIDVAWGDEASNLHAVWDGLPTDMEDLSPSKRTSLTIEAETVDDQSIDEWLHHHGRLAEMFVYPEDIKVQLRQRLSQGETPEISVSHEYLVRARSVARRQINLAGHRIAHLLN